MGRSEQNVVGRRGRRCNGFFSIATERANDRADATRRLMNGEEEEKEERAGRRSGREEEEEKREKERTNGTEEDEEEEEQGRFGRPN